jgi:hypothetical protein
MKKWNEDFSECSITRVYVESIKDIDLYVQEQKGAKQSRWQRRSDDFSSTSPVTPKLLYTYILAE